MTRPAASSGLALRALPDVSPDFGDDLVLAVTILLTLVCAFVWPVCLWSPAAGLGWRRAAAIPPALLAAALACALAAVLAIAARTQMSN